MLSSILVSVSVNRAGVEISISNYTYKLIRESSATLYKENYWIVWFVLSRNLERLNVLNLETLEYRRLSSDLTMYYKVFHNLTPWAPSDYFNIVIPTHIFILFIVILTFVSHCVVLIYLQMIVLTVASLRGIVCLVLSIIQSLLLRLSVLLYLLICPNF